MLRIRSHAIERSHGFGVFSYCHFLLLLGIQDKRSRVIHQQLREGRPLQLDPFDRFFC